MNDICILYAYAKNVLFKIILLHIGVSNMMPFGMYVYMGIKYHIL